VCVCVCEIAHACTHLRTAIPIGRRGGEPGACSRCCTYLRMLCVHGVGGPWAEQACRHACMQPGQRPVCHGCHRPAADAAPMHAAPPSAPASLPALPVVRLVEVVGPSAPAPPLFWTVNLALEMMRRRWQDPEVRAARGEGQRGGLGGGGTAAPEVCGRINIAARLHHHHHPPSFFCRPCAREDSRSPELPLSSSQPNLAWRRSRNITSSDYIVGGWAAVCCTHTCTSTCAHRRLMPPWPRAGA